MHAMLPSILPINESTMSSEEMSISTPRAWVGRSFGEFILQRHGEAVVHVHLDGHEEVTRPF